MLKKEVNLMNGIKFDDYVAYSADKHWQMSKWMNKKLQDLDINMQKQMILH